jgi:hypothetical protein
MHGLARCVVQGRIAGMTAATEEPDGLLDAYELETEKLAPSRG